MINLKELTDIVQILQDNDAQEQVVQKITNMRKEARYHSSTDYTYDITLLLSTYWKGTYEELYGIDKAYTALTDYISPKNKNKFKQEEN